MNRYLKRYIPFHFALIIVLVINSLIILFHAAVLLGFVPFEYVWGGKLQTAEEMYVFESVSIAINLLLIGLVLLKGRLLAAPVPIKLINVLLWAFVAVFALNTLGNLAAETTLETLIATPLTFILAILCWRLALSEDRVPQVG
ncbi:hypothetical protein I5M27_04425 [Adhaeribacter sp. BT258]|uniref:Uncharacterized protein n=1 Tax=Adhaeribacter terrigena TaxID=2793070 RepID=A0ABS1BZ67_9BACT|nr:hypothetical protein [Adhaeribacter terrigena]MBK0402216.1 hypothetical protein [Adhaeribacter terrigena]